MEHSFDYMTDSEKKICAKTFLNNTEAHIHSINDVIILIYSDFFISVNKKSLIFNCHETEVDALNHVLDFYKGTDVEQTKLFN